MSDRALGRWGIPLPRLLAVAAAIVALAVCLRFVPVNLIAKSRPVPPPSPSRAGAQRFAMSLPGQSCACMMLQHTEVHFA